MSTTVQEVGKNIVPYERYAAGISGEDDEILIPSPWTQAYDEHGTAFAKKIDRESDVGRPDAAGPHRREKKGCGRDRRFENPRMRVCGCG